MLSVKKQTKQLTLSSHLNNMKDCCYKNLDKAILKSRAYWICPICGSDVSLAYYYFWKTKVKKGDCTHRHSP
jgi:hypothetical protein